MNINEVFKTGVKIFGMASVAFVVPGCQARPISVDTFPQASSSPIEPTRTPTPVAEIQSTPIATPSRFPDYVKWCLPVKAQGGIITLPDGREMVAVTTDYVVLEETTSGDSPEFKRYVPGEKVTKKHGPLYKCRRSDFK